MERKSLSCATNTTFRRNTRSATRTFLMAVRPSKICGSKPAIRLLCRDGAYGEGNRIRRGTGLGSLRSGGGEFSELGGAKPEPAPAKDNPTCAASPTRKNPPRQKGGEQKRTA